MDAAPLLLIVDDEKNIINALKRLFWDAEFEIAAVSSAEQALEVIQQHRVQVLLSDYKMPGMTGIELIQQVKRQDSRVICMLLTGYSEVADIDTSLKDLMNKGVSKLIEKPWKDSDIKRNILEAFDLYDINRVQQSELTALNQQKEQLEAELEQTSQVLSFSEQALKLSQQILDCLPTPIVCFDQDGLIVLANQNANRLLGVEGHLLGLYVQDIVHASLSRTLDHYLAKAQSSHLCQAIEIKEDDYLLTCTCLNNESSMQGFVLALQKQIKAYAL